MKSSLSLANGNCVDVELDGRGGVLVRHSKLGADGPSLRYTRSEWDAFIGGVKNGEFDYCKLPLGVLTRAL